MSRVLHKCCGARLTLLCLSVVISTRTLPNLNTIKLLYIPQVLSLHRSFCSQLLHIQSLFKPYTHHTHIYPTYSHSALYLAAQLRHSHCPLISMPSWFHLSSHHALSMARTHNGSLSLLHWSDENSAERSGGSGSFLSGLCGYEV